MGIELYDVSVAGFLQGLGALEKVLEKGAAWCAENGRDPEEVVAHRVAPDMLPFRFQVISSVHHSLGAINGVKAGVFSPPSGYGEPDYAGLQKLVTDAVAALGALSRDEVNALQDKDMMFSMGKLQLPFKAQNFLMSFSIPNHQFHMTMTYGILRSLGVGLGKTDYLGKMRFERQPK